MQKTFKFVLSVMFFLSGMCSLVYQIIWIRLAYAHFGAITPVLSVAVSVFMLGLALGSWYGGKYIDALSAKTKIKSAVFYGFSEILIGIGAVLVPVLFMFGQKILFFTGQTNSYSYIFLSAIFLALAMLPWCIAMGTTFPFAMSFIKQITSEEKSSFSFLYAANVLGSVFGVVSAVVFIIEIFGLKNALYITALINLLIAGFAFFASVKYSKTNVKFEDKQALKSLNTHESFNSWKIKINPLFLKAVLFITGFVSLGLEVAWTRAFSPALGAMVYTFSFLLAGYLFATYIGTTIYRKHLKASKVIGLNILLPALAVTSFIPIIINDPNLLSQGYVHTVYGYVMYKYLIQIVVTVFPVCMVLGYMTPAIIDYYSEGDAKKAGHSYAINTLGCILGPLAVSYLMLPFLSAKSVMVIMSILYVILFLINMGRMKKIFKIINCAILAALIIVSAGYTTTYEMPFSKNTDKENFHVYRDSTATVIAHNSKQIAPVLVTDKHIIQVLNQPHNMLLVNGYGMTILVSITKLMAHLPLAIHENPQSALVICFGMGTTYRSMLSWDINVKAVELVPSVVKAFPVFFDDAEDIIKNPKGEIIIDDGRRYLMRTKEKFDIITIDPAPPVESSGSSMLYSREFYKIIKTKLNENGILQHWFPDFPGDERKMTIMRAVVKTITEEFPYVKIYCSIAGAGLHISASMSPMKEYTAEEIVSKMPQKAKQDMNEWMPSIITEEKTIEITLSQRISPEELLKGWQQKEYVSDSHPYNEYYLIRDMELK